MGFAFGLLGEEGDPQDPTRNAKIRWPGNGEAHEPCADPRSALFQPPSSMTPAFSHSLIRRRIRWSAILHAPENG
jgi:hypothetical protein